MKPPNSLSHFGKLGRERYLLNPPEGMISDEVRDMSDDGLLGMDYFLHEFDV